MKMPGKRLKKSKEHNTEGASFGTGYAHAAVQDATAVWWFPGQTHPLAAQPYCHTPAATAQAADKLLTLATNTSDKSKGSIRGCQKLSMILYSLTASHTRCIGVLLQSCHCTEVFA